MTVHNPQLYTLAQEWAQLRQNAKTERDPDRLNAIVDRLDELLHRAEQLAGLNDKVRVKKRTRRNVKLCGEREMRAGD